MDWDAKWIWNGNKKEKNQWVCFRKKIVIDKEFDEAFVYITADSRYRLFMNGKDVNIGPARSWPNKQAYDVISVGNELKQGENIIAVLVNFYGESTSQYVHGQGGLLIQLEVQAHGQTIQTVASDDTWLWKIHQSYITKYCRINVAQPWVEIYDADAFAQNWTDVHFDDSDWVQAEVVGNAGCNPWCNLQKRSVPLFSRKEVYARNLMEYVDVEPDGIHVCINVRDNFFLGTTDTIDKGFLGYLAVEVMSPCDNTGYIQLICRKTPAVKERMKLNGEPIIFAEDEDIHAVTMKRGKNFLLLDISGYHQRFNMNYRFCFEKDIELSPFVTIGPFQKENLLNIVAIDHPLNFDHPLYQSIWNIETKEDLESYSSWVHPVDMDHCLMENPHILTMTDRVVQKKKIEHDMGQMLLPNRHSYLLKPDGHDQRFVVDFGKEVSGIFEFELDAPKGVILDVDFAECNWNGKFELSEDMNSAFRYKTTEGYHKYSSFLRRGYRYAIVTVRNMNSPVRFRLFKTVELAYSILPQGKFECSDWELNKIWEISARSVELCMEDTYVDCPAYEQAYWIGDGRIEALVNYYTHGAYELTKHCVSLVGDSLKKSDLPEAQVPTGCNTVLTAWFLLWILSCKEYYEYTGDIKGLEHTFEDVCQTIDRIEKYLNEDGLFEILGWNMLDWAGMDTPVSGVVTHQNFLLVKVLRESAKMAELLKQHERAEHLLTLAQKIQEKINQLLWDDEHQAFIDSIHEDGVRSNVFSIQTQIMAYLCGCVDGEREQLMIRYILDPPDYFIQIGSPFMSFFYYEALEKTGGYTTIVDNIRDKWGDMLRLGATSCWETFLGFEKNRLTRSHCHGWSAAPGYFLSRAILGVRPTRPGFEEFVVEPHTCGLWWAKGQVPTPHGIIYVEWEFHDGELEVQVEAPEECTLISKKQSSHACF